MDADAIAQAMEVAAELRRKWGLPGRSVADATARTAAATTAGVDDTAAAASSTTATATAAVATPAPTITAAAAAIAAAPAVRRRRGGILFSRAGETASACDASSVGNAPPAVDAPPASDAPPAQYSTLAEATLASHTADSAVDGEEIVWLGSGAGSPALPMANNARARRERKRKDPPRGKARLSLCVELVLSPVPACKHVS